MADIDFDELDKAVNDLMANVDASKRPAGLDEPEEKVVDIPTSAPVAATPTTEPASTAPASPAPTPISTPAAPAPTPAANPSLAVKRRGQFMDIMHPARDMNPAKPVSRQGATIQPGNGMVSASAMQQNEATSTPVSGPADTSTSSWPDPIDMAAESAPTPQAPLAPTTPSSDSALDATAEAPLTSPFLPDAKPEKRPLGNPLQADEGTLGTPEPSKADTSTPVNPETPPPAILPEEFSGDLMAVESRDLSSHPDAQPVATPSAPEQPKLAPGEEEVLIPAVATPDPIEQPKTSVPQTEPQTQLPAGGSITQQYTEQPSSGDQSNGSIYDTSAYHQPIEPVAPVKKKTPTSVWIMLGVGLLLVGAIGGAAFFYFTR